MKLLVFLLVSVTATYAARKSYPEQNPSRLMQLLEESLKKQQAVGRPASRQSSGEPARILSSLQQLMQRSSPSKRYGLSEHPNAYRPDNIIAAHAPYTPAPPVYQYKYTPKKYFYYSVHDPLSNKEIKEILLHLLHAAFYTSQQENLSEDDLKILWHILNIFRDLQLGISEERKCPYGFTRSDNLCLCGTFVNDNDDITFDSAREFCQEKGGDLAIYKDANEFVSIVHYLHEIDPDQENNFLIGATKEDEDPIFFIDGTLLSTKDGIFSPGDDNGPNVILSKNEDFRPVSITDFQDAIPLCQYIKARDGNIERQRRISGIGEKFANQYYHPVWSGHPTIDADHQKRDGADQGTEKQEKTSRA